MEQTSELLRARPDYDNPVVIDRVELVVSVPPAPARGFVLGSVVFYVYLPVITECYQPTWRDKIRYEQRPHIGVKATISSAPSFVRGEEAIRALRDRRVRGLLKGVAKAAFNTIKKKCGKVPRSLRKKGWLLDIEIRMSRSASGEGFKIGVSPNRNNTIKALKDRSVFGLLYGRGIAALSAAEVILDDGWRKIGARPPKEKAWRYRRKRGERYTQKLLDFSGDPITIRKPPPPATSPPPGPEAAQEPQPTATLLAFPSSEASV